MTATCEPRALGGPTVPTERGARCDRGPVAAGGTRVLDRERMADHIDRLYRVAFGLCGTREEAEDLVQETFARVLRKPRMVHAEEDVGYLLRVLRNTFLTIRRDAGRRPRTVPLPDTFDTFADRRETPPEAKLEARYVYGVIASLPESFRGALIAVDVAGLSYREAARSLDVGQATLTTRLHRARQRVARELSSDAA